MLQKINEQYPDIVPLLGKPGVFQAVANAINENWPAERLTSALRATEYYQNTDAQRSQWDILQAVDPATARRQAAETKVKFDRVVGSLGILNTGWLWNAFENSVVYGWDENRIRSEIIATTSGGTHLGPGGIGDQMTQFQGLAAEYGVPVNHNDLYWWAANTIGGSVSQEGYRDYLTEQAINLFPVLKPSLEQGMTVKQYAAPYLQQAANELGINPSAINLQDPKWTQTFIGADEKGQQSVLNLNQSLAKIRTDAQYNYDQGAPARTQAATFASQLLSKFGAA